LSIAHLLLLNAVDLWQARLMSVAIWRNMRLLAVALMPRS
jgi:hypothetical protein